MDLAAGVDIATGYDCGVGEVIRLDGAASHENEMGEGFCGLLGSDEAREEEVP